MKELKEARVKELKENSKWALNFVDGDHYIQTTRKGVIIPVLEYIKAKDHDHNPETYADYLGFIDTSQAMMNLAEHLTQGIPLAEQPGALLKYAQSHAYDFEEEKLGNYVRMPFETVAEGGGDCEDTTLLFASLAKVNGNPTALAFFPSSNPKEQGHVLVGIAGKQFSGDSFTRNGVEYFYAETTGEEWQIGKLPDKYKGMTPEVYVVE